MRYRMFAHSVPGKKYTDKGWPCQDSSLSGELNNLQVIAIADGHGSNDCFRSQIGSSYIVEIAVEQAKIAFSNVGEECFSDTAIRNFKYVLWSEWRKRVREDWYKRFEEFMLHPEEEIRYQSVSEKVKARYTSEDEAEREKYLYRAYGTTLICAILLNGKILLLQVGDGTCVVLSENGEFSVPIPKDEDNFLNVTFSFCSVDGNNADEKIRHVVLDYDGTEFAPLAVFLSTDGLDDCFPYENNEYYLYKKVYAMILRHILEDGYLFTEQEIKEKLLPYMTDNGSKDDISLAYFITDDDELLCETNGNISAFLVGLADISVQNEGEENG